MIDRAYLDSIGDNWMVRTDNDGEGYGGFKWKPAGQWTTCPKWSDETKANCESGGLFGQGPGGYGYAQSGTRFLFCETSGPSISVDDKIKVREAVIVYVGSEAYEAMVYKCGGVWPGSLDTRGGDTSGLTALTSIGGWLDTGGGDTSGLTALTSIGGWLYTGGNAEGRKTLLATIAANKAKAK